jgi:alpha-beta hydrolase superfamily lysophospholipase
MTLKEYHWNTKDHLHLYGQVWKPETPPKAVVNYVHGFGSHSNRAKDLFQELVKHNIAIVTLDYRGHGRSSGKRGYAKKYDNLLSDIKTLIQHSKKTFPKTPAFLYGHSLGGNLAINYILRKKHSINGVIATSPWIKLTYPPGNKKIILAKILSKIFPRIIFNANINPNILSRDKTIREQYMHDNLVHNRMSPKLYFQIEQAGKYLLVNKHKINIPVLLMHGNHDKLTSHKATKYLAKNTGDNTVIKIWKNNYHELHNEPNKSEVIDYIVKWINDQLQYK